MKVKNNFFNKKTLFFIVCLIFFINFSKNDYSRPIIGLKAKTGRSRFGDSLNIIYITLYLSEKYKLPIFYEEFTHSNDLVINDLIKSDLNKTPKFKNIIKIRNENEIKCYGIDTLLEVDVNFAIDKINIDNISLKKTEENFKKLITPSKRISFPIKRNNDCIYVAVHIRKGGGYDLPLLSKDETLPDNCDFKNSIDADELAKKNKNKKFKYSDVRWPFKFPPDSFYVEQIKKISEIYKNQKIHVHIFTDDKNPKSIVNKYKKLINLNNITYSCREINNSHNQNIIEDFFSMSQFDCLIRPISYFSENVQRIGNFKIVIYPQHGIWVNNNFLIIDKVNIIRNL